MPNLRAMPVRIVDHAFWLPGFQQTQEFVGPELPVKVLIKSRIAWFRIDIDDAGRSVVGALLPLEEPVSSGLMECCNPINGPRSNHKLEPGKYYIYIPTCNGLLFRKEAYIRGRTWSRVHPHLPHRLPMR